MNVINVSCVTMSTDYGARTRARAIAMAAVGATKARMNPWCVAAVYAGVAGEADVARACWAANQAFKATFSVETSTDMDLHLSRMETTPGAMTVYHAFFDGVCQIFAQGAAVRSAQGVDGASAQLHPVAFYVRADLPDAVPLKGKTAATSEVVAVAPLCAHAAFVFPHARFNQLDLTLTASQPRMGLAVRALPDDKTGTTTTAPDSWVTLRAEDLVEIAATGATTADAVRAKATEWAASGRVKAHTEAQLCATHHVIILATADALRGRDARTSGARVITDYAYDEVAFRRASTLAGAGAYLDRYVWFNVQRKPLRATQCLAPVPTAAATDKKTTGAPQPVPLWMLVDTEAVCARFSGEDGAFLGAALADAPWNVELLRMSRPPRART